MQTDEFPKFREGITGVMEFYKQSVSKTSLDIWWRSLRNYDLSAIIDAFDRHLVNPDTGQFPPKPADITKMLQGSTQDSALRAWAKVDQAVRQVGTYSDVVFDDSLIHRVIQDMGGWIALGTKGETEWPFIAKEFENRYRGFKVSGQFQEYPAILIGITSAYNKQKGFKYELPMLIGDESRAIQVMNGGTEKLAIGFKQMSETMSVTPLKQLRAVV